MFAHVRRQVNDDVLRAPAITGGYVVSTRGGDFEMHLGQGVSIAYSSHTDTKVTLYLQETFTFRLLTAEAYAAPDDERSVSTLPGAIALRSASCGSHVRVANGSERVCLPRIRYVRRVDATKC